MLEDLRGQEVQFPFFWLQNNGRAFLFASELTGETPAFPWSNMQLQLGPNNLVMKMLSRKSSDHFLKCSA